MVFRSNGDRLAQSHTAHALRSHKAVEADKMDEFCGTCLIFLHL